MALSKDIMGGGFSAGQAHAINGQINSTATAAGTTQGTATAITTSVTIFSTVASNAGGILPTCDIGDSVLIYNAGANALSLYPNSGSKINNASTDTAVSLGTNTGMTLIRTSTTQWIAILSA